MNKDDIQNIYEIYRACRLCGAGAGYKMPIVQSVIDLQGEDIELQQKIKECVQIEVKNNDRMPPLICELCVDKINDFFEFRRICQETNRNTRLRLGLPQESLPQARVEHGIPGAMEIVYLNSDSDEEEPLSKRQSTPAVKSKPKPKSAKLKEEVEIEVESSQPIQKEKERLPTPEVLEGRRETRGKRPPSPKRATRQSFTDDSTYLNDHQEDENSLLVPRPKRSREVPLEFPPTTKKSRLAFEPPYHEKFVKPGPKSSKAAQKAPTPPIQQRSSRPGPKSRTVDLSLTPSPSLKKNDKSTPYYSKELLALLGEKVPAPNAKKPEVAPSPGPKSKKVEVAPSPGPKSKKAEVAPSPGPKSKKVEVTPSPGPKSRKSEVMPSPEPKSRISEATPGPKFSKELLALYGQKLPGPTPKTPEVSPAPGPKRPEITPRRYAGSKSKKIELSPLVEPTSNKRELTPVSEPKSKKREMTSVPGSKSKRGDVTPSVESKLKQTESSHAPITKTKRREPSPAPSPQAERKALPAPPKSFDCCVCDFKTKHANALTAHLKSHTPQFTPIKQACNPCELWFSTTDEASWHHRRHTNKSMPYTCTKCYDDFRTMQHYELHFTRNQCLPTYEVPDVKCDECWRYFPTYKLLEDHKCPGEGGRPGGKCSKCSRTYSLLKYQIAHEMKCSFRKKGEPLVDPEVSSRLLPMQVRVVKCDLFMKPTSDDRYDVSALSNKFGLDRNCNYPYLNSMDDIRVRTESQANQSDNMVSVKVEVKAERQKDDDSNVLFDSGDSDVDTDAKEEKFLNLLASDTPVDTLSTMSLNTILTPKCLDTIPRKKHNIKDEKALDSIMSRDTNDLKSNISYIIDSLRTEAHASDSCDSDSILDKSQSLKPVSSTTLDVFDSPTTKSLDFNTEENTGDPSKDSDKINSDKVSKETVNDDVKTIKIEIDTIDNFNNGQITENRNDTIDGQENEEASNITKDADIKLHDCNDSASVKSDDASEVTQDVTNELSNSLSNKSTIDPKNGQVVSNRVANEKESLHIEDKGDISRSEESEKIEIVAQSEHDTDVSLPLLESRGTETIGEQNDRSSPINQKNKVDTDSGKDDSQSSDFIEDKTIEDLNNAENDDSQSSFVTYKADSDNTIIDSENTADTLIDSVEKNDECFAKSIDAQNSIEMESDRVDKAVLSADKFNINNLNADDKVLMAKLDAHIAEDESKSNAIGGNLIQDGVIGGTVQTNALTGQSEVHSAAIGSEGHSATFDGSNSPSVVNDVGFDNCDEKKESLDELMRKRDADLRSLDLDSISDEEFNFDI